MHQMHTGRRYTLFQTLSWSRRDVLVPLAWAAVVTAAFEIGKLHWIALPWLPVSAIAVGVAFYLGFKNNASYDRLWEARKIWGAIVNASRSWAFSARDLVSNLHGADLSDDELRSVRSELVLRHVAWLDALRFQLRKVKSWEHEGPQYDRLRAAAELPELVEALPEVLDGTLAPAEREQVLAQINPAAHLLANQSRHLAELRQSKLIDGFAHIALQELLHELMTQQGKAERIKNFPFPRQYATVNSFFAVLFAILVPFGMVGEFAKLGEGLVWLTVPFSAIVCWVFLTTDRIGDWSENPFEGLANDVPISAMARGIERDIRQMIGEQELPPARKATHQLLY
jgi:ion channel-forming bestrophin family protein